MTGIEWAQPFLETICPKYEATLGDLIQALGRNLLSSTDVMKVIVSVHPRSAHPLGKTRADVCKAIVDAFEQEIDRSRRNPDIHLESQPVREVDQAVQTKLLDLAAHEC